MHARRFLLFCLSVLVSFGVQAQAKYPQRTVEVVVPYAPGGGTDNLMRMITGIMEENKWAPVPMNVNNRAGGSGAVGYNYVLNKKGDAHVIAGATPMIVSGKIEGRVPGNHRDGFTPIMIVAIDELMISVRSESPFKTIEQFVKAARDKPASIRIGGTATYSEDHIFTYLFEQAAKVKVRYVPFNSGGEVTAALLGGHIDAGVMNPNEIQAQVEAKQARNLAVASKKRLADAADVPTFAEKGMEFYWEQMRGVVGPANMPPEAVKWWQDTLKKVTDTKKWQEQYIKKNLLTPVQWTGDEANKYLDGEGAERAWSGEEVVRKADLVTGALLLLGALAFSAGALRFYAWSGDGGPGPAFLPFWLGLVMAALACGLLIKSFKQEKDDATWLPRGKGRERVLVIIVATLVFFALLKVIGMELATFLYVAALMRYLERKPWLLTFVVAAGAAAFNWLIFAHWLHVPFPQSWLFTLAGWTS